VGVYYLQCCLGRWSNERTNPPNRYDCPEVQLLKEVMQQFSNYIHRHLASFCLNRPSILEVWCPFFPFELLEVVLQFS